MTPASVRNNRITSPSVAPIDLSRPISRVLSHTAITSVFTIIIAATNRLIPPIVPRKLFMNRNVLLT